MWGLCQAGQALLSRELLFPCLVLHLAAFCEVLEKEGGLPEHGLRSREVQEEGTGMEPACCSNGGLCLGSTLGSGLPLFLSL